MSDLTIGAKPIRQPDEQSFGASVRITLAIFVLATPFFLYMGLSATNVQEEYRLSRLVEGRRQLMKEHERLLLTRDALLSPGTVNAIAREKLGMVEEDAQEWTVGLAPAKTDGGMGRGGDGGSKNPSEELGSRKLEKKQDEEKSSDKGRGADAAVKANDRPAFDPKMKNSFQGKPSSGKALSTPLAPGPSAKASGSGRVADAVARPKPAGGPGRASANATTPRTYGGTR